MPDPHTWQEFPWERDEPDAEQERLCIPAGGVEPMACRIEGADLTHGRAEPTGDLVVVAYNLQRGRRVDEQLDAFSRDPAMPAPDILLLSEADRGCTRTGGRNVAREYARALGMYYVYGVEFVELPRWWGPDGAIRNRCEHGNAVVSRYPLGNVELIRHRVARSWDSRLQRTLGVGQPRLGGRVAVCADVRVGGRLLRVYSVHFESRSLLGGARSGRRMRAAEAAELVDHAGTAVQGAVIGGDMNVVGHLGGGDGTGEPATDVLAAAGFRDAHAGLAPTQRRTSRGGGVIDLVVGRGVTFTDAGVGSEAVWGELSDHLPVWARLTL